MEAGSPVVAVEVPIALVNDDEVYEYIQQVRTLVNALEELLHQAPSLRFAPRLSVKKEQ